MANVNMTPAAGASNYPDLEKPVAFYEKIRRIDMADAYAKKGSNLAAADVIQAVTVRAGEMVCSVSAKIITACSAAMTATIGDGDDPDGYVTSVSLNGTAGTVTSTVGALLQSGTTPFAITQGKVYSADDTIDLVLAGTAANNGVVEVRVLCRNWNA